VSGHDPRRTARWLTDPRVDPRGWSERAYRSAPGRRAGIGRV